MNGRVSTYLVSANASKTQPAKLLAMIFAQKGSTSLQVCTG